MILSFQAFSTPEDVKVHPYGRHIIESHKMALCQTVSNPTEVHFKQTRGTSGAAKGNNHSLTCCFVIPVWKHRLYHCIIVASAYRFAIGGSTAQNMATP